MAQKKPLSISTTIEHDRPQVEIDGALYHVKSGEELSLEDKLFLGKIGQRFAGINEDSGLADLSDAEIENLAKDIRRGASIMNHDIPVELFEKLSDEQKLSLIGLFQATSAEAVASGS